MHANRDLRRLSRRVAVAATLTLASGPSLAQAPTATGLQGPTRPPKDRVKTGRTMKTTPPTPESVVSNFASAAISAALEGLAKQGTP